MKMHYDPEVDALFIQLRDTEPAGSFDYEDGVTGIVDDRGHIIAIEILDAGERLDREDAEALFAKAG